MKWFTKIKDAGLGLYNKIFKKANNAANSTKETVSGAADAMTEAALDTNEWMAGFNPAAIDTFNNLSNIDLPDEAELGDDNNDDINPLD